MVTQRKTTLLKTTTQILPRNSRHEKKHDKKKERLLDQKSEKIDQQIGGTIGQKRVKS